MFEGCQICSGVFSRWCKSNPDLGRLQAASVSETFSLIRLPQKVTDDPLVLQRRVVPADQDFSEMLRQILVTAQKIDKAVARTFAAQILVYGRAECFTLQYAQAYLLE